MRPVHLASDHEVCLLLPSPVLVLILEFFDRPGNF